MLVFEKKKVRNTSSWLNSLINKVHSTLLLVTFLFTQYALNGQCTNGSQPECTCETAEILCSSDDLNGFSGEMSFFTHPGDAPAPFCGSEFPDNPNWFGFVAWCDELTLDVEVTNCSGSGVQLALFTDCTFDEQVDCDFNCNGSGTVVSLDLDLIIGEDYFLLLDGCGGSVCDFEVTVSPLDCDEQIEDWSNDIDGELEVCVGEDGLYVADLLVGAINYHWLLDGVEIQVGEDNEIGLDWNTPGVFELCVDVSNACVPVGNDPEPNCVEINVLNPEIEDWTNPIDGEVAVCVGQEETYTVDDLLGASNFHWFLDGLEIAVTEDNFLEIDWDSEGMFELCVDASNEPCASIDDDPNQICLDIVVFQPFAGDIFADPEELCPGEISEVTISGFSDEPGVETVILVTDDDGDIVEILAPPTTMVTYEDCENITVCSYTFSSDSSAEPMLGQSVNDINCSESCCDIVCMVIDFSDDDTPDFLDTPDDFTISCFDDLPVMEDLEFTDNCIEDGTTEGVETIMADICFGGTVTRTWSQSDGCENTRTYSQTISIDPLEEAVYDMLPADETVNCVSIPTSFPTLNYSNGMTTSCVIEGQVLPDVEENFEPLCGGTITVNWLFEDQCNRELLHTQIITIEPGLEAVFINPPSDATFSCTEDVVMPGPLMYNNSDPNCPISGMVDPDIVEDVSDVCGGTITATWEFIDDCDRTITHEQVITVDPALAPVFSNLPDDATILCSDPNPAFDDLQFTNMDMGTCLIEGMVSPDVQDNTNECGGTIISTWEFEDECGRIISHAQTINVDPPPPPVFIDLPINETVSCADIPLGAQDLAFTNNEPACLVEGTVSPDVIEDFNECGGTITYIWEFSDPCDNTINHLQVITIEPAPVAAFLALPMDLTMSCEEFSSFVPDPLFYSNGASGICMIEGTVDGEQIGVLDLCGGVAQFEYTFTDACDRTITHTQLVTVEPAPIAAFDNLPANMTLACDENGAAPPSLTYTNGASGDCLISGSVSAITSGVADECGGVVSFIWTFTDECDRTISHTQVVTFLPASEPVWIDPPVDSQLDCENLLPSDLSLEYDNGEAFPCVVNGFEDPNIVETDDAYTLTWTFTNPCSNMTITHEQVYEKSLTVDWPEEFFEFTICETEEFDLSSIILIDQNNTNPTITYHDGFFPDASNEINSTLVSPNSPTSYYILGNNAENCPDIVEVLVEVETIFFAGSDNEGTICVEEETLDLFDYLANDSDFSGDFFQISGPTLNIGDPESINISSADPGIYMFNYVIEATDFCPEDIAVITIEISPPVEISIIEISCAADFQTYIVETSNNGYDINVNAGTTNIDFNTAIIENIPINTDLEITITDNDTDCEAAILISPPNCDCPDVEAPISDGDFVICVGEAIPELSVSILAGQTANWFDAPIGGSLLAGNTSTFTPTIMDAGVYTFYVESESLSDPGCTSDTRIAMQIEILSAPVYSDLVIEVCDEDQDGILIWDEETLRDFIGFNLTETATYYMNQSDAETESNSISLPWSNIPAFSSTIYSSIKNAAGCPTVIQLDLNIYAKPILEVVVENESCYGAEDGAIMISNYNPSNTYLLDGIAMSGPSQTGLMALDYELILEDENGCGDTIAFEILPGTELSFESFVWNCNDGGTNTDPSDDFYEVAFTVQSSVPNASNMFELNISGLVQGNFAYGVANSIMLPADMSSPILTFTDIENACEIAQNIGPLNPCSTNCVLTAEMLEYICNGNGTPTDPTDDFYDVTILANAVNGSSINRYNVSINGVITFSFEYGIASTFTLPADGNITTMTLIDSEDLACSINESLGPLEPCSDACVVTAEAINIICDNNGTDDDNGDDVFYFDLSVMGLNTGLNYEILSLGITEAFGTTTNLGPFNISDGILTLEINDEDDSNCSSLLMITPPLACSDCNQTVDLSMPNILSCAEPETSITVTTSEQGIFSWTGPDGFTSTSAEITVTVPGVYEVLVSFFNGCMQSSSVEVFSDNNIPIALAGPDQALTCSMTMLTLDASNSTYPSGANFEWTDSNGLVLSTGLTLDVTEAGSYFFLIIDPLTGCNSALEEVVITLETGGPSSVISSDSGTALDCEVSIITLSSPQEANVTYTWTVNGNVVTGEPIVISEASEVNLYAFNSETGCDSESNITILDLMESPMIIFETEGEIECEGGEVCIDASATPNAQDLEFSWTDGVGTGIGGNDLKICVTQGGTYSLEVTDLLSGCISVQSIGIDAPIIPNITLPNTVLILPGENGELTANVDLPMDDILEIIWSPASFVSCQDCLTTTIIGAPDGQVITLEVISISGCRSLAETIVQSPVTTEVYIPNIFNTDSTTGNNSFTLYGNEQVLLIEEMFVYDRWGNMVFKAEQIEPNNPALGWNGKFDGQDVEQGVYVYFFKVLYANGENEVFTGDVTNLGQF